MAGPNKPSDPDDDALFGDAEIFFESPTAPSAPSPLAGEDGGEIPMIAEPLPEMFPDIWQAGIQALVAVSDGEPVSPLSADEWAAEAEMFAEESKLRDDPGEASALLYAAGRASLVAGDAESSVRLYERALAKAPASPEVLRARAQLAESQGDFDGAQAMWERLAEVAANPSERELYRMLSAEWTLARTGAPPARGKDAISGTAARALAVAEVEMLAGRAGEVAAALAEAGTALTGPLGGALWEQAARIGDLAGDRAGAQAAREQARKLDPETSRASFGLLLDAARSDDRKAAAGFAELAHALPSESRLAHAAARAGAGFAIRHGDEQLAASLFAELPPTTIAAARDRIDFEVRARASLDAASLDRLREEQPSPAGVATLAWIEASSLVSRGDSPAALTLLGQALEQAPDAVVLGLLAEDIAGGTEDPATRAAALALWLRVDPARRAEAALALAAARGTLAGEGDENAVRPVLQAAIDAAPGSALFWRVAVSDARAGRRADAAATLRQGAASWSASALAPGLRACAVGALGAADPAAALAGLAEAPVARAFGAEARARLAARVGDRDATIAALAEAAAGTRERDRRAALLAETATRVADPAARARLLGEALEAAPDGPLALALRLGDDDLSLAAAATALARAGAGNDDVEVSGMPHVYRLTASAAAELGSDPDEALHRASELVDSAPGDRQAHLALIRAASRLGTDRRARAIGELPANPGADPSVGLVVAEALVESGDRARAAVIFRELAAGRFASEARRALARLGVEGGRNLPPRLLFGAADDTAAVVRAELAETLEAARTQQWPAVVAALESGPPHQDVADAVALHTAALIAEGRVEGGKPMPLERAVLAAAGEDVTVVPSLALARLAADTGSRGAALAAGVRRFAARGDARSVAVTHTWIATSHPSTSASASGSGESDRAADSWRAALAADPSCLSAALALRREVARRGDVRAAIDAAEVEASCLRVPAHKVRALLLAAALAEEMAAETSRGNDTAGRGRALRLLRAALEVDPAHDAAFEQLRSLLEQENDASGLAAALAARIAVAQNPFEVTSLRLARAEVLAGKLSDRAGAEAELQAILHKQPEHPRALARLSELHWDGEEWSQAGEVYLRRTVVEREPKTLREILLRLGHIYGERVPDPKRAIGAFERVRALEPDNRDALRALSELYVAENDIKQALPITDRLVTIEPNAGRRASFRVRLGEILMRNGDVGRATSELRAAVDALPRNVGAVSALAQLYERTRDATGRRSLLDHTAGLLRHDIERGGMDLETLRALAGVLPLRERPHAAASAAQLVAHLAGRAPAAASWSGRELTALRRPDVDERAFPPALPPGVRQMFRLVGPLLRPSGQELVQALARHGVGRSDRVARGTPPRPLFDAVGVELHAGEFDLYVKSGGTDPGMLRAEPGTPASLIVGSRIATLGAPALRFAAARSLRLVATGLDLLLAGTPDEGAALLVGIVRQFVPEYRHPDLRDAVVDAEGARAARVMSRKLRSQVMPFAVESAGPFEPAALHAAVRDCANATGLLATGDLPTALKVVLAIGGGLASDGALTLSAIGANPEALALLRFAVSDAYDDLVSAITSA